MRRTEHTIARVIVAAGLVAGLVYLTWRAMFSLAGTDLWLSIPVLLVEFAGFVGSALLAWALWPYPSLVLESSLSGGFEGDISPVDVLVRVDHQGDHELRATLLALRAVAQIGEVIVVDVSARPAIASIANEFRVACVPTLGANHTGLVASVAAVRAARALLLDAGDVPTSDIVTRLGRHFADERVAVVQGLGVSFAEDSIEHGPHGRHDLAFERGALNPALGARGCAFWTGSGSLVAVDALREAVTKQDEAGSALESYWAVSAALLSAQWRIVSPADFVVVAHRVEAAGSAVTADRCARVRAARALVAGRRRSLTWRQRLALLAWCVRPLSGLRRAAFVAVLVLALYAGSAPFTSPTWLFLAAWLPAFVAVSLGLGLLSGWKLRPGDRARWSLLSLGPARNGSGLVAAITAVTMVLVMRGISDQFTHALGRMSRESLVGLVVVALWTLALSLDGLRLLARRTRRRSITRVASASPAILGERSAQVVDLTPHGAGLLSQTATAVGERLLLVSTVSTASGIADLRALCVVHSSVRVAGGYWRIGVKFAEVDNALANALSEYCTVEPMWERLGVMPETSVTEARRINYVRDPDGDNAFIGKGMLRFLSLVALSGAVASSLSRNFDATRASATWLAWVVVAIATMIGASVLLGMIRPRGAAGLDPVQALRSGLGSESGSQPKSSSSPSPDLAIK